MVMTGQATGTSAVLESPAMVRATRPGVVARRAVLLELRRRRGVPASAAEVASALELDRRLILHHLRTLEANGLAASTPGRPIRFALTAAGRIATD